MAEYIIPSLYVKCKNKNQKNNRTIHKNKRHFFVKINKTYLYCAF